MQLIGDKRVEEYINNVCLLVKNKKVHENIKEELLSHIDEIVEDVINEGKSKEEAIAQALMQMGSFEVVGKSLNKVHKAEPDWILLAMTSIFIAFSMITLVFMRSIYSEDIIKYFLKNISVFLVVGIIVIISMSKVDYRSLKKYSKHIYIGTIIISILGFLTSEFVNGAKGWLRVGPLSFNIFHITPILFIIALAGIFENYDWNSIKKVLIGSMLAFIPALSHLLAPSLPNVIIYIVAVSTLMIISGIKLRDITIAISSLGVIFIIFVAGAPYRIARMLSFLKPLENPYGSGWIYNQIATLRNSAVLFGQGESSITDMLPGAYSEYIFTYILYTFGWIVGIILMALVLAFIIRIAFIGISTKDKYGKLIVSGFCAMFAIQFLMNILMNFNLFPSFSVAMPFISYTGTGLIFNVISVGIITNIHKWRNTPYITN